MAFIRSDLDVLVSFRANLRMMMPPSSWSSHNWKVLVICFLIVGLILSETTSARNAEISSGTATETASVAATDGITMFGATIVDATCKVDDAATTKTVTTAATSSKEDEVCAGNTISSRAPYASPPQQPEEQQQQYSQCGLYLAVSTIPGAGLGVFSGVNRQVGETVGNGDPLIPLVDVFYHLHNSQEFENDFPDVSESLHPTENYVWDGPEMGLQQELTFEEDQVSAYCPGLDAATNCNFALINIDQLTPTYDDGGLHRSHDPGAGAFSPYHNSSSVVTAPIPAGGELFKFYGDEWFTERESMFPGIPLSDDYPKAEQVIKNFDAKIERKLQHLSAEIRGAVWSLMKTHPLLESRTLKAIPSDYSQHSQIVDQGLRSIHQPAATKSLQELQQYGRCVDTIEPKPSTLPQTGRGAFSKQFFAANTIVTGTPLLFAHSGDLFRMYAGSWFEQPTYELAGHQLLLNYCWHHPDASLYLCPYGYEVSYINHNQTLANVRLQWAHDGVAGHQQRWLEQSPSHMEGKASPGLFVDYVATRDIEPGEEIFLDYGDLFEEAWREHVANFNGDRHKDYISARNYNKKHGNSILKMEEEQESSPYPENLELRCLSEIQEEHPQLTPESAKKLWTHDYSGGVLCTIVDRQYDKDGNVFYTIKYLASTSFDEAFPTFFLDDDDEMEEDHDEVAYDEEWVVREAITFADVPYSTDSFLKGAFRHPVGIPDEIFPAAWKGYRKKTSTY